MDERRRPIALIVAFVVAVGVVAAVTPAVQNAVGLLGDILALIMLGSAIVAGVSWLVARRWFPPMSAPVAAGGRRPTEAVVAPQPAAIS